MGTEKGREVPGRGGRTQRYSRLDRAVRAGFETRCRGRCRLWRCASDARRSEYTRSAHGVGPRYRNGAGSQANARDRCAGTYEGDGGGWRMAPREFEEVYPGFRPIGGKWRGQEGEGVGGADEGDLAD